MPNLRSSDVLFKQSVLTPDYMTLLQSLCTVTKPSVNDVTTIFKEFRRSLNTKKSFSTPNELHPGASKTHGGKSVNDGADVDGCGNADSHLGFERSCTWEPGKKRCWIVSDFDLWNRILARNCLEIREYKWGENSLEGYLWPEKAPESRDLLRASLLVHLLLRQHRCVTNIFFDVATTIEMFVVWHALKTGAADPERLECRMWFLDISDSVVSLLAEYSCAIQTERVAFCEAIAATKNITLLNISNILFNEEVVSKIGVYVEQATALTDLHIVNAVVFGNLQFSPSALLAAAVQSRSLQSLIVHNCHLQAKDIEHMASALTRDGPAPGFEPPPPTSPQCRAHAEGIEAMVPTSTMTGPSELLPNPPSSPNNSDPTEDTKAIASALTQAELHRGFEHSPPTSPNCSANAEDVEAGASTSTRVVPSSRFEHQHPTSPHCPDDAKNVGARVTKLTRAVSPAVFEHTPPTSPYGQDHAEEAMDSEIAPHDPPPVSAPLSPTSLHCRDHAKDIEAAHSVLMLTKAFPVFKPPPPTSLHDSHCTEDKAVDPLRMFLWNIWLNDKTQGTVYRVKRRKRKTKKQKANTSATDADLMRSDPPTESSPPPSTSPRSCDLAEDKSMDSALTRAEPPTGLKHPPPRIQLQYVTFMNCKPGDVPLQEAYAKLIAGTLRHLHLFSCGLGDAFAKSAAAKLRCDRRLRRLAMEANTFTVDALRHLIGALEVNKTLECIEVTLTGMQAQEADSSFLDVVRKTNALPRLYINWMNPRSSDFLDYTLAAVTPSIYLDLVERDAAEMEKSLAAIAKCRDVNMVQLKCATPLKPVVVQALIDTLAMVTSINHLYMCVSLCDEDVVKLFGALERNRTITFLNIGSITFRRRTATALGRLVANNRSIVFLAICIQEEEPEVDHTLQVRYVCRTLKEVVGRNRFLMALTVSLKSSKPSNDPVMKKALSRNTMLVNQAVRFVDGSMDKADALAFDTLRHCQSVLLALLVHNSRAEATSKLAEARQRLSLNYFLFTGVVKANIVCNRNSKAKMRTMTFDNIGRNMQALICSYLSLTDVLDA
ncbi:uncharacterized protein LOC119164684 isoform X3 [Rhipicephalus microplus]|uniref:uncharacterized protein LOC119164684 isoform X3 n=1 Tax=Rhipicephalus microplus TaxID=6941 RepID=UPI003F6B8B55